MSQSSNAFQKAAEALGQVRDLVISGNELRADLRQIIGQAESLSKQTQVLLQSEVEAASGVAEEVLQQYRIAALDIAKGVRGANEHFEATSSQIRATAVQAVNDLNEKTDTAVKRIAAEVIVAQERFGTAARTLESTTGGAAERVIEASQRIAADVGAAHVRLQNAAAAVEASTSGASSRILEASKRVEHGTSLHGERLTRVSSQAEQLLVAFESGAKAIASAEQEIRLAREETRTARSETAKAKDEIVALRTSMRRQLTILIISVLLVVLATAAATTWLYLKTRSQLTS